MTARVNTTSITPYLTVCG